MIWLGLAISLAAPPVLADLQAACATGDQGRCVELGVRMEWGEFGPGRSAEALELLRADPRNAQLALLIADVHPWIGTALRTSTRFAVVRARTSTWMTSSAC